MATLPDAEIMFRTWTQSITAITDLVSTRVATRLPQGGTMPFLVLTQISGMPSADEALIYEATLSIDAYAGKYGTSSSKGQPDYAGAYDLATTVIENAFDSKPKKHTATGGEVAIILGCNSISGPSRIEEPELGLARYNIEVVMIYGAST